MLWFVTLFDINTREEGSDIHEPPTTVSVETRAIDVGFPLGGLQSEIECECEMCYC